MHSEAIQIRVGKLAVRALVHLGESKDRTEEERQGGERRGNTDPQRVNGVKWVH